MLRSMLTNGSDLKRMCSRSNIFRITEERQIQLLEINYSITKTNDYLCYRYSERARSITSIRRLTVVGQIAS